MVDALDQRTSYGYDELGNRTSQTDANGHVTRFEYDRLGRETKRRPHPPGGAARQRETKTYDVAGNLETRTDFMGRVTSYSYDDNTTGSLSRTLPEPRRRTSLHLHGHRPTARRRPTAAARRPTATTSAIG